MSKKLLFLILFISFSLVGIVIAGEVGIIDTNPTIDLIKSRLNILEKTANSAITFSDVSKLTEVLSINKLCLDKVCKTQEKINITDSGVSIMKFEENGKTIQVIQNSKNVPKK